MKQIYKYDNNGFYLEPVRIEDNTIIPTNCTVTPVPNGLFKARYIAGQWVEGLSDNDISALTGNTLDEVKANKIAEITESERNSSSTFISAALGSIHTYLSDDSAMAKFNAEYTFVNGDDYTGQPILWFTLEEGGVNHTKEQFNQVWAEGRNYISNNFKKWDDLVKRIKACNSISQVQSISW